MLPPRILYYSLILTQLLLLSKITAQSDVKFKHYTLEDGLPEDQNYQIIQDNFGFIWTATNAGLARFDGHTFKVYRHDPKDYNSLSNDLVIYIYIDRKGILWVATADGLNQFDRENNQFIRHLSNPEFEKGFNIKFSVTSITEDKSGNLWLGTYDGLVKFDPITKKSTRYRNQPNDPKSLTNNAIDKVYWDSKNYLWIGTVDGLDRFDPAHNTFVHYRYDSNNINSISHNYIYGGFVEDAQSNIWIGTYGGGLNKFDRKTELFSRYQHNSQDENSLCNDFIWYLNKDAKGNIMISTDDGFDQFDPITNTFFHYRQNLNDPYSLMGNYTLGFLQDSESDLWIGSNDRGLNHLYAHQNRFIVYDFLNNFSFGQIESIKTDQKGNLWIGSEKGLFCINRITNNLTHYQHNPSDKNSLSHNMIKDILVDNENIIWIVTNNGGAGLDRLDPDTGTFTHFWHDPNNAQSISSNAAMCLFQDSKGNLWIGGVGTPGGLNKMNRHSNTFTRYLPNPNDPHSISSNLIYRILEDQDGHIWVGTRFGGLDYLDINTDRFTHFLSDPKGESPLRGFEIKNLYVDRKGNIWIGTSEEKGIYRYNPKSKEFSHFLVQILTRFVTGMCEDEKGNFWINTHGQGIIKFNPDKPTFRQYHKEDGLSSLVTRAAFRDPYTGKIYFSDSKSIVEFHPDSIQDAKNPPPIFITTLKTYQKDTDSDKIIEVEEDITFKKNITVSYKKNTLSFQFAVLSFSKPTKNQYAYQLEGFNDQWIQLGTEHDVTFTNLAPGHYTLRVKGANGDGYWNETPAELHIRITHPWYWNVWTKSLYTLLLIGAIYYFYQFQLNRRLALAEAVRLQELDEVKTRLYTNITHEFRTPLTIILGMADKIEQAPRQWLQEGVQMIKRNGQNLLRLVNQMLDLAKLEGNSLPINMIQGDVVVYVRTLLAFFRSYADSKNITLEFTSEPAQVIMDYDPEKLKDIISNLLSNALKFTPEHGCVKLAVRSTRYETRDLIRPSYLELCVRDNGLGITSDKLLYIFDRFYQGDDSATRRGEGTGIGLALTKELVKLLGGNIDVESEVGKGTAFIVRLPIHQYAPLLEALPTVKAEVIEKESVLLEIFNNWNRELPLALVVEDNTDVMTYLATCLQDQYRLEVAYNGKQGIDKAIDLVPDVIISDVMMPEKDGFELCRTLKNDIRTSHIPIILLTALGDTNSRLEGLEGGADAYLTKPFNQQELEISLRKSLELRQRLRERYANEIPIQPDKIFSRDDMFVKKLQELVETQYASLTIEEMAELMHMSHAQLGRKVNALLGTSPHQYLHRFRMQKAYHLVKNTDLPIKEIAYNTGFSSPARFSNAFLEAFQQRPSDLR